MNLCADASSSNLAAAVAAAVRGAKALRMRRSALLCQGLVAHGQVGTHKLCAAYLNSAQLLLHPVAPTMLLHGLATD
jgi:hypothetical protein